MFDSEPINDSGKEPEDIFNEVNVDTGITNESQQNTQETAPQGSQKGPSRLLRIFVFGFVLILVVLIIVGGIYWFLSKSKGSDSKVETLDTVSEKNVENTLTDKPAVDVNLDTDEDGLNDILERDLGSDPRSVDTDGDGLNDYQEYRVFGSNLLQRDSDGDGYSDGDEVKNGYNPAGEGKLSE